MIGNILHDSGIFCGECKPGDEFNKDGYFENIKINKILGDILKSKDVNKEGRKFSPINLEINQSINQSIAFEFGEHNTFFIKNIKIALLYNLFLEFNPKIILIYRDRNDIIKSFYRTNFMNQFDNEDQMNLYLDCFFENMNSIKNKFSNVLSINSSKIMNLDILEINKLEDFLGLRINFSCIKK